MAEEKKSNEDRIADLESKVAELQSCVVYLHHGVGLPPSLPETAVATQE